MKEVPLDPEDPEAKIFIGSSLPEQIEEDLLKFLKSQRSTFAWKPEDMTGISQNIITHKLGIDPSFRPYIRREGNSHLKGTKLSKKK